MVRSIWVGALVAIAACTAPGWGQVQQGNFITVREDGKPAVKCKVVKCWKEKDGSRVCQVQAVDSGEMMTVVDSAPANGAKSATSSRVYNWGKSKSSPKGVPVATSEAKLVSHPAEHKSETKQTGLFSKMLAPKPAATTVVKANVETPAADMRQSWGKVEPWTPPAPPTSVVQASSRPELPLARKAEGDPLERPDIYTTAPASMPAIKSETTAELPLPVGAPDSPRLMPKGETVEPATTTTTGECATCTPDAPTKATTRRTFANRDFAGSSSGGRSGLLANREKGVVHTQVHGNTGLMVKGKPTTVAPSEVVTAAPPVKHEVARNAPAGEPHVGVFAGLFNPVARTPEQDAKPQPRSNSPAGMTSIVAASKAASGTASATPVGAIVRMPDGQHRVIDLKQGQGIAMPTVQATGSNAFAVVPQVVAGYQPDHQTLANAFTRATPRRALPVDDTMVNYLPNGLNADGMGGAETRPAITMTYGQPMMMGYYPTPGMLPPAVVGMATPPGTIHHLAALRQSLMPSERERAVAALTQVNWKADPQVVPALVMAAQTDPAPAVRLSCVRALGTMKANTLPAVQAVTAMTKDQDARIRHEAERVLPMLMKH